jgi:hypothetical protein
MTCIDADDYLTDSTDFSETDSDEEEAMEFVPEKSKKRKREDPEEEPGEPIDTKSSKFKVRDTCLLLTYKTHIDKDEYFDWFNSEKGETKFLRIAHETGDIHHPYLHSHVLVSLLKQPNWRNPRCLDYKGIHPNIKTIKGGTRSLHWENAKNYLAKEDPENEDLKKVTKPTLEELAESHRYQEDFVLEAVRWYPNKSGQVSQLERLFLNVKRRAKRLRNEEAAKRNAPKIWGWQTTLLDKLLKTEPSSREIVWVWGPPGIGKTSLVKYMKAHHKEEVLTLKGSSAVSSVKYQLAQKMNVEDWDGRAVVLDCPMGAAMTTQDWMTFLEEMKDGDAVSDKYVPTSIERGDAMHLVILSNHPPPVGQGTIADERWADSHEIVGGDLTHRPLTQLLMNKSYPIPQ